MDLARHATYTGRLMAGFQMLETAVRLAVEQLDPKPGAGWDWLRLREGERVPVSALSDFRGLRQTLERYNALVTPEHRLATGPLVRLRDALAHGRVFTSGATGLPLFLVKFGEPTEGHIPVERAESMTTEWFTAKLSLVHLAIDRVKTRPK